MAPVHAALLLLAVPLLASAQDTPSATSPPFPLDSNGEAHFNIPVVVKLADLNAAAPPLHRRADDSLPSSNTPNPESPPAPFHDANAKIDLAPPALVEPAWEVLHQGSDSSDSANNPSLLPRQEAQPFVTHTVLLVETTGTATSTVTEPCNDTSTTADAITASIPENATTAAAAAADNTTTTKGHLPPAPMNHTSFPLRNGTDGSLPCNSTGWVRPSATGARPSSGTGGPMNPVNVGGNNKGPLGSTGAAARVGGSMTLVVAGVVAAAVAAFAL
ncbi:uncharacterized protein HMPREF1541_01233 [Cyphellophora europaea CBS 101466]|uniref:Ig-like domain-containing protein n=1 Tax=Cyphellophora europaea (strain CBS 101466) TaxID=1220924 RepID=W2SGB5_CYPE1|nr:uncharacterized protein HMPREF1541_01233 [Cyphellophora europaea CBS 101466]ETN47043.1 hypothetical protein HMPREF1541_01233 [Cyphellophora europaea CBS 101466]